MLTRVTYGFIKKGHTEGQTELVYVARRVGVKDLQNVTISVIDKFGKFLVCCRSRIYILNNWQNNTSRYTLERLVTCNTKTISKLAVGIVHEPRKMWVHLATETEIFLETKPEAVRTCIVADPWRIDPNPAR